MARPVLHIVSISGGKDSLATALIALERCPAGSVAFIFCDTGNEHAAVYDYLDYLEAARGIVIHRLRADFSRELLQKRLFIARDERNRREVQRVPVFDSAGLPVPARRPGYGAIVTREVKRRDGTTEIVVVQKTRKVAGARLRWTNKAKRRALAVMHPNGNPFLDLCMWKGRFPSRKAQFCTEELKRNVAVAFQLDRMEAGYNVLSWQGVRRDESENRRHAKKFERVGRGLRIARPIVDATAADVFRAAKARGIRPNPLYLQDMSRVGCMPLHQLQQGRTAVPSTSAGGAPAAHRRMGMDRGQCSKRGFSTFMTDAHPAKDRRQIFADLNIWSRIEWSKTTRGGKQYDLLAELDGADASAAAAPTACATKGARRDVDRGPLRRGVAAAARSPHCAAGRAAAVHAPAR